MDFTQFGEYADELKELADEAQALSAEESKEIEAEMRKEARKLKRANRRIERSKTVWSALRALKEKYRDTLGDMLKIKENKGLVLYDSGWYEVIYVGEGIYRSTYQEFHNLLDRYGYYGENIRPGELKLIEK